MQRLDTSYLNQPAPNNLESPLESLAKVTQYRNMLTQGRLHEQQIANEQAVLQQHQLAIAETQRAQKDSETYDAAFKEAGGHFQPARDLAISRGVRSQFIEKREDEYNKHVEQIAKADTEGFKAAQARVDYLHERLAPIAAEPDPVRKGALFMAMQAREVKDGRLKPEEVIQYTDPSQVDDMLAQNTLRQNMLTDAKEKREADEAARKEAKAPAEQTKAEQEAITAKQKATGTEPIQPQQAQASALTMRGQDLSRLSAQEARALTIRGQNMTDARSRELADLSREAAAQAREDKPPTSAQSTVATYAERLRDSNKALETLTQGMGERVYNKFAPNFLETETGQAFDQAERNFINAILRRESGAVISPSEFSEARKQYIPQPGDAPKVLEQKTALRKQVTDSFKKAAGKAYTDPDALVGAAKPVTAGGNKRGAYNPATGTVEYK